MQYVPPEERYSSSLRSKLRIIDDHANIQRSCNNRFDFPEAPIREALLPALATPDRFIFAYLLFLSDDTDVLLALSLSLHPFLTLFAFPTK